MEGGKNAADQQVQPEQRIHLAEPLGDHTLAVGELQLAAVAHLAAGDQVGQHGNVPTGE